MTSEQAEMIVQLLAVNTQLLTEIRDVLTAGIQAAEDSEECQHPMERRVDFSTMTDRDHWKCMACGFDSKEPPMN